jgi:hypothetical protein
MTAVFADHETDRYPHQPSLSAWAKPITAPFSTATELLLKIDLAKQSSM